MKDGKCRKRVVAKRIHNTWAMMMGVGVVVAVNTLHIRNMGYIDGVMCAGKLKSKFSSPTPEPMIPNYMLGWVGI